MFRAHYYRQYSRLRTFQARSISTSNSGIKTTSTRQKVLSASVFAATCFGAGYAVGRDDSSLRARHTPEPRSCCDASPESAKLEEQKKSLVSALRARLGETSVITEDNAASPFTVGARIGNGGGKTIAVACPDNLQEAVDVLQLCVDANVAVVPQGANTGLTGGSVPRAFSEERLGSVVLSMRKLKRVTPIANGKRVVCLAGAGILDVGAVCAGLDSASADGEGGAGGGREAHSALGSTFLNPSVAGGVSFGSGGTQLRKGPAYTERALYCVVGPDGQVKLVDTLGLTTTATGVEGTARKGGGGGGGGDSATPTITATLPHAAAEAASDFFGMLESGTGLVEASAAAAAVSSSASPLPTPSSSSSSSSRWAWNRKSSATAATTLPAAAYAKGYAAHVCAVEGSAGNECSRFNADTCGPPPNRCEGKCLVLATVHETFPKPLRTRTLWVSCGSVEAAAAVRRACLATPQDLPASCEYMDAHCCETVDRGGRGLVALIRTLGMAPMESVWALRSKVDSLPLPYAKGFLDRVSWWVNPLLPPILTPQVQALMQKRKHNVLVEACDYHEEAPAAALPLCSTEPAPPAASDRLISRILAAAKGHEVEVMVLLDKDADGGGGSQKVAMLHHHWKEDTQKLLLVSHEEGAAARAKLFRFACAPAFATRMWGQGCQGLSLDYALPKAHGGISFDGAATSSGSSSSSSGPEETRASTASPPPPPPPSGLRMRDVLPSGVTPVARCVYGHFGCNVVHEDLLFAPGVDVHECKRRIKAAVEAQGGKLPAEHGHGTEYEAPPETQARWMRLDPTNALNPGVGGTKIGPNYTGPGGLSH